MIIIKCTNCKKDKKEEDFSIRGGRRNKQCRECRKYYNTRWEQNPNDYRDIRKQYYKKMKDAHRSRNFKNSILKKYGLSVEKYNEMILNQNNKCAICDTIFDKEKMSRNVCVDHCHRTNKVRGLLCRKCNISLYYIESLLFDKAKEYLRVNGSTG